MFGIGLPVVRTFIHFGRRQLLKRSCSAPAEVFVDFVLARARERERLLQKRRAKKTKRVMRKWEGLLRNVWQRQEQSLFETQRKIVADQIIRTTPLLRERLETRLFKEFACVLLPDKTQETLLWEMGVLRKIAREVHFWCGEEPMGEPVMQTLLGYAKCFRDIAEAGNFQIHMTGATPLVARLRGSRKEDVRRLVEKNWKIPPEKQILVHLGRHLKHGVLEDQGMIPGGCVHVARRI